MSKTIAELRASSRAALPEWPYEVCLSQQLVAEVQGLQEEKSRLEVEAKRVEPEKGTATKRKMAEGANPRIEEIDARLEALYDEMREHTGTLVVRAHTSGSWRRWCDEHPPREDGRDERGRPIVLEFDESVAYGFCNASDLMARLGEFAVSWNGVELQAGDWEWITERAAPGDLKEIARQVVLMHEGPGAKAAPKLPKPSSTTGHTETS